MINKNILIFLAADNFNETEFSIVYESLKKNGFKIFIASDAAGLCVGATGLKVKADVNLFNIHPANFDSIILIGGSGIKNYWENLSLHKVVKRFNERKKIIAAICSAPVVLGYAGLLSDKSVACYPKDQKVITKFGAIVVDESVSICENIITGKDSSSSREFVEQLIKNLNS